MQRFVTSRRIFFISSLCISLISWCSSFTQADVQLKNPSFEGEPFNSVYGPVLELEGWLDCALFSQETAPDIHSGTTDFFDVKHAPYDGRTYLGLVVRENETWECIVQKLPDTLVAGVTYVFTVYACQAKAYRSPTKASRGRLVSYVKPVILRIWGGQAVSDDEELLGESLPVDHEEWRDYTFSFVPSMSISTLVIEAYYVAGAKPYPGHVLIDNAQLRQSN